MGVCSRFIPIFFPLEKCVFYFYGLVEIATMTNKIHWVFCNRRVRKISALVEFSFCFAEGNVILD